MHPTEGKVTENYVMTRLYAQFFLM